MTLAFRSDSSMISSYREAIRSFAASREIVGGISASGRM
jgi:hypothetical protein